MSANRLQIPWKHGHLPVPFALSVLNNLQREHYTTCKWTVMTKELCKAQSTIWLSVNVWSTGKSVFSEIISCLSPCSCNLTYELVTISTLITVIISLSC